MEYENIITRNLILSYLIQDKLKNIINMFDEKKNKNSENIEEIFSSLPENLQTNLKNIFSDITNELQEINKNLIQNDNDLSNHFDIHISKKEKDMYIKLIKLNLV